MKTEEQEYKLVEDVTTNRYTLYINSVLLARHKGCEISDKIQEFFGVCDLYSPEYQHIKEWVSKGLAIGDAFDALKEDLESKNRGFLCLFRIDEHREGCDDVITVVTKSTILKFSKNYE
jgi:hypothetical protein